MTRHAERDGKTAEPPCHNIRYEPRTRDKPNATTMAAATTNSASEVEETLARIRSHKGVEGVIIMNREGEAVESEKEAEAPPVIS